ncbi:hypothetical protein [Leuconostoc mesenteroides]|uniref:hypothetical protein n=1 Tax=Leuconostoc mesenteroides TaxID=1245 RepID=UPI0022E5D2E5|nr:hypothetical protein [Leuconostoc mesenteroides]
MLEKIKNVPFFITHWLNILYPAILALIALAIKMKFPYPHKIIGFNDVLTSIVSFSAIIIGFYTAMYGVLISISDSDFMKKARKFNLDGLFKYQLYDSLAASFITFLISVVVQVMMNYNNKAADICFDIWVFCTAYFLATSFRSISLLIGVLFHHDQKQSATSDENLTETEKAAIRNKINENNNFK